MNKITIRNVEYEKNEQNSRITLKRYDTKSKMYVELKFINSNDDESIIKNIQNKLIKILVFKNI